MEYGSRKKDIDIYYKAFKFVKQTDKLKIAWSLRKASRMVYVYINEVR